MLFLSSDLTDPLRVETSVFLRTGRSDSCKRGSGKSMRKRSISELLLNADLFFLERNCLQQANFFFFFFIKSTAFEKLSYKVASCPFLNAFLKDQLLLDGKLVDGISQGNKTL